MGNTLEAKEILSAREVARLLRMRFERVIELLESGEIPSRKSGKRYLVSREAVLRWVERR